MRRLVLAAALAVVVSATPAAANVLCYVEASAGKNITTTRVGDEFSGPVTIAADGLTGGVGAGCDVELAAQGGFGTPVVGILARYDFSYLKTAIGTEHMSGEAVWSVAARGGIRINPGTLVYGLAGVAGTQLAYPGLNTDPTGILLGGGIEIDIAVRNLTLFAEYDHMVWDKARSADGLTSIRPDSDVFRVGLRLKLDLFK